MAEFSNKMSEIAAICAKLQDKSANVSRDRLGDLEIKNKPIDTTYKTDDILMSNIDRNNNIPNLPLHLQHNGSRKRKRKITQPINLWKINKSMMKSKMMEFENDDCKSSECEALDLSKMASSDEGGKVVDGLEREDGEEEDEIDGMEEEEEEGDEVEDEEEDEDEEDNEDNDNEEDDEDFDRSKMKLPSFLQNSMESHNNELNEENQEMSNSNEVDNNSCRSYTNSSHATEHKSKFNQDASDYDENVNHRTAEDHFDESLNYNNNFHIKTHPKFNFSSISMKLKGEDRICSSKDSISGFSIYDVNDESIKRFSSYEDCKDESCLQELIKDHFHCLQCKKVIIRREEMIRHSKWHKKREESLQYNFMRFSPNDDCKEFTCSYNGRQTHYHCLHLGCTKIYISTSDVQMHANFHKKDAAINQEGFQRYRATELCRTPSCSYSNQRTTHFHCVRPQCRFTFKNKADMDKHKSHHSKNDALAKEGFKKFIKYEHCDYVGCKFSKVMNHIHCIRDNCDYVVHSSAQINSHRRKHDRRIPIISSPFDINSKTDFTSVLNLSKNNHSNSDRGWSTNGSFNGSANSKNLKIIESKFEVNMDDDDDDDQNNVNNKTLRLELTKELKIWDQSAGSCTDNIQRYTANDPCNSKCPLLYKDHYHCLVERCHQAFKLKERLREHCRRHKIDNLLLKLCYRLCTDTCTIATDDVIDNISHYHCKWTNCTFIRSLEDEQMDSSFFTDIFEHFETHDLVKSILVTKDNLKSVQPDDIYQFQIDSDKNESQILSNGNNNNSTNSNNERKRGRPPKYKKNIQIPKIQLSDTEINDDGSIVELIKENFLNDSKMICCGFKLYTANDVNCIDDLCMFHGRNEHYHCLRPRCYHATDSLSAVNLHRREFHHYMQIETGYEYFDRSINCRRAQCQNNSVNNHYHCVRAGCDYSFKRFNTMHQHTKKHNEQENNKTNSYKSDSISEIEYKLSKNSNTTDNNHGCSNKFNSLFKNPLAQQSSFNPLFPLTYPANIFNRDKLPSNMNHLLSNHHHHQQQHQHQHQQQHHHPNHNHSHNQNNPNPFLNFNPSLLAFHNTLKSILNNNSSLPTANNSNSPINYLSNILQSTHSDSKIPRF